MLRQEADWMRSLALNSDFSARARAVRIIQSLFSGEWWWFLLLLLLLWWCGGEWVYVRGGGGCFQAGMRNTILKAVIHMFLTLCAFMCACVHARLYVCVCVSGSRLLSRPTPSRTPPDPRTHTQLIHVTCRPTHSRTLNSFT